MGGGGTEYGYGGPKTKVQGGDVMQGFYNGKKLGVENYMIDRIYFWGKGGIEKWGE